MHEIISRAQAGDSAAQEELLRAVRPQLRLWAEQALNQRYVARFDASDITQETLLDLWQKIEQFLGDSPEEFFGWVKQVLNRDVHDAIRHASALKRSREREQSLDSLQEPCRDPQMDDTPTPSQHAIRNEEVEQLSRALSAIPPDQARAIELVQLQGMTLDQAAEEMGRSKQAVVQLLKRGILSLKKHMPSSNSDSP